MKEKSWHFGVLRTLFTRANHEFENQLLTTLFILILVLLKKFNFTTISSDY